MSDDTRVEYSVEATVNVGNFENVKPGYKISTNVREGEHPNDAIKRCEDIADKWIVRKVDEIRAG